MPRKRSEVSRFNAVKALDDEYEQRIKRKQELAQEKETKARHDAEVNAAWQQVTPRLDLPSLQKIGEVLVRWNYTIWVDFLRVDLPRNLQLAALAGCDRQSLLDEEKSKILALRLLIAACGDSELTLESELNYIAQLRRPDHVRAAVREALWQFSFEDLEDFHRHPQQPTPWIIRAEFERAVQGSKGFSKKVIDKWLTSGELSVAAERRLNKKSKFYRFYHRHPRTHDEMLRLVIAYLKKQKKFGSSDAWHATLWDSI